MKRKNPSVLVLLLAVLMTGCGSAAPRASAPTAAKTEALALQMLCQPEMLPPTISGNEAGAYETMPAVSGTHWNLTYTDYATGRQVYLCNQPNCNHTTEACSAYLPGLAAVFPMATQTQLLLNFTGDSDAYARTGERVYLPHLELASPQGTQRRTLAEFSANAFIYGAYAGNDDILCFVSSEISDDAVSVSNQSSLNSLELKNGKGKVLIPGEDNVSLHIIGAQGDWLLVKKNISPDLSTLSGNDVYEQMYRLQKSELWKVNPYTAATQQILQFKTMDYADAVLNDFWVGLKALGSNEYALEVMNLSTLQQETLLEKLPFQTSSAYIQGVCGNSALVSVAPLNPEEEFLQYQIELTTGEVRENRLKDSRNAARRPLLICAQTETSLFVERNSQEKEITVTGKDGTAVKEMRRVAERALISKTDYLNSQENYTVVAPLA